MHSFLHFFQELSTAISIDRSVTTIHTFEPLHFFMRVHRTLATNIRRELLGSGNISYKRNLVTLLYLEMKNHMNYFTRVDRVDERLMIVDGYLYVTLRPFCADGGIGVRLYPKKSSNFFSRRTILDEKLF